MTGDADIARAGPAAPEVFADLGVDLSAQQSRRQLLRFCVDWSEQRHQLGELVELP
jgi:hypothetical protein